MKNFSKFDAFVCFVLVFLAFSALSLANLQHPLHHHRRQGHHQPDPPDAESAEEGRSSGISGPSRPERSVLPEVEFSVDNDSLSENCSHCEMREAKRSYRVEAVKADILWKLRMNVPPNVTGRRLPDIPQIRRIIEHHSHPSTGSDCSTHPTTTTPDEEYDDSFATTLKYVLFAQRAPASVAGSAQNVFYFQFQSEMSHQQIVNATISIYVRRTPNPGLSATWLLLYRLGQLPPAGAGESQERETMRRRRIQMSSLRDSGQWFSFDIRTHVERWIQRQNVSYGIMVQVSDGRGEPLAIVQPQTPDEADRKPYLIIRVRDQGTPRMKRNLDSDCDESSAESRCCRYPLTIDFEQFGWDWVIVPKRYPAYYCSGDCPYQYYQHQPHTGIVQQAAKLSGGGGGGPCCAPRKVSPISMLYYDEYMNIIYGRLPGMIVDQCGCS